MFSNLPNANEVWNAYLLRQGFTRHIIPDTCPACYTVEQFSKDNPHGVFIVATGSHAVCVKDGNVLDAWDSSGEVPTYYYAKEKG